MKTKSILLLSIITAIIFSSVNKGLGQCVEQSVTINNSNLLNVCTGYVSSCLVTIFLEQNGSDNIFNPVQLKRPDGSIAIGISSASATRVNDGIWTYTIPGGYLNQVGNWQLNYSTKQSCTNPINKTVPITVYGFTGNTIGSDEIICNGLGIPSLINNISLSSNSGYSIVWQFSDNGSSWNTISSAMSTTYQPAAINKTTWYKRIVTTNTLSCPSTSNIVTKNVYNAFSPGAISGNQNNCYNIVPSQITQNTPASGGSGTYSYEWYVSWDGSSFSLIPGETGTTYQPGFSQGTRYFKRRDYDLSCGNSYTNVVTIQGYPILNAGAIGSAQTICYNSIPGQLNVTTAATGGMSGYLYQWEESSDGFSFIPISGAIGTIYQPPALLSSKWYRLKVINSCNTDYTSSVKITVYNPFNAGSVGAAQTICYNNTPVAISLITSPTGGSGAYSYVWEGSSDGSIFSPISGATGTGYQPGALYSNTWYRLKVINSCETLYTNIIKISVYNPFSPGSVTSDQTICNNSTPSAINLSTASTGGTGAYSYAWESSLDGSVFNPISGAIGTSYQPGVLTSNSWYRLKVTNSCLASYTNTIKITVRAVFDPGTIGSTQTICYGVTPALLNSVVSASGGTGTYSYSWESSPNGIAWSPISGATNESYQPSGLTSTTYYRRNVINPCGSGYTNTFFIIVRPDLIHGTITNSQTICYNTTPSLLATGSFPTGGTGSYTYQWQNSVNNSTWNNIAGATAETYQPGAMTSSLYYRRSETSGSCGTVQTNSLQIFVNSPLVAGTIKSDQAICYGITPGIFLTNTYPSGGTGSYNYQWQKLIGSIWTDITGANNETYTSVPLTVTSYFRRAETSGSCGTVNSNQITVDVRSQFFPGVIGSSQTVNYGAVPAELVSTQSPSGGSGTFTYQWQNSLDNSTWSNISGATYESFQPPALTVTKYFKRLTTDGSCGVIETNVLTINVNTSLVPGVIKDNQTICYNVSPSPLVTDIAPTGGNGTYSYQWQKTEDGINWNNITAANSDSFQPTALVNKTYFRKKVNSATFEDYSNIVTITVNPAFAAGAIGSDQAVCKTFASSPITTTVLPVGQSIQNLWQISDNNASWTDITEATNDYYDAGVLTASKYFRKKVTSSCGTGYTNSVNITVNDELQGGIIGSDQAIAYNTSPSLLTGTLPTGGSGTFSYQWYYSVNNIDWLVVITLGDGKDYQPGLLSQKTFFKRKVTGGSCGEKYSNTVTVTVFDNLLPGVVGDAQSICYRTVPSLLSGTSPTGGTGQYSYQWQYSLQGVTWSDIPSEVGISYRPDALTVNTYYRRAVTSGNSTVYSNFVMIKVYDQVSLPETDLKISYCKGTAVNINIVNPAYLSYKWFDSGHAYLMDGTKYILNSLTAGNTVYVKSLDLNGCLSDYHEQKIIVDNVQASFTTDITTVTLGDAIKFTNTSVNASSYSWNFFDGDIITEHSPVHYYNTQGINYKKFSVQLVVKSPGGCVDSVLKDEIISVVNDVTGIETNKEVTFSYYPNPVSEKLWLTSNERVKIVKIFNISGKMIKSLIFDSEAVTIDFSSLKSDIYILEINGFRNSKKNIKIIKK